MKKQIIFITGTPGCGKTTFASEIRKSIPEARIIEINEIVKRFKLFSKIDNFGSKIVQIEKLSKKLNSIIDSEKKDFIVVVGHIAPELDIKPDVAFIIRISLKNLEKRLKKRNYPNEKIKENLISESIDYLGTKAKAKCKKVYEIKTYNEKKLAIKYLKSLSKGKSTGEYSKKFRRYIEEVNELMNYIKMGNKYKF
ncbi:MAG: AAA family ATPase [Candidatus Micrarchaeia archaeon]